MSLKHAILSLLSRDEKSGYDIVKGFDTAIGYFWQASHQQVYKTLATMEEVGWVIFRVEMQEGKPDKKLYSITPQGQEELINWVNKPGKQAPYREEILIKLLTVDIVGAEVILCELKYQQEKKRQRLAVYADIERQHFPVAPLSTQAPLMARSYYLTLRRGITSAQATLDWLEEAEALLSL